MEGQKIFQWLPQETVGWAVHGYRLSSSRINWPNVHKTFLSDEELEAELFVKMLERPLGFGFVLRWMFEEGLSALVALVSPNYKTPLPYFNISLQAGEGMGWQFSQFLAGFYGRARLCVKKLSLILTPRSGPSQQAVDANSRDVCILSTESYPDACDTGTMA